MARQAFDPRDWCPADQDHRRRDDDHSRGPGNPDRLLAWGLAAALCLCVGSVQPTPGLTMAITDSPLVLAALGSAPKAVWRGERVWAERLTAWDQAALLAPALPLRGPAALDASGIADAGAGVGAVAESCACAS